MAFPKKTEADHQFAALFGKAIRAARKQKGLKAEAFAQDLGVTPQTVSNWETGTAIPTWPSMFRIADVLGLHLWQLVRATELTLWKRQQAITVFRQGVKQDAHPHD